MFRNVTVLSGLVVLAWIVEILDFLIPGRWLDSFGIRPRTLVGLFGIFLAPFLHANFAHLAANTVPFLVLGFLVALRGLATYIGLSLLIVIFGGLGVWLFGATGTDHIGASGVIFGYLGYLLARGYFERRVSSILIAIVVVVLYGGALWGVLPGDPRISWQAHLFGFMAGVGIAWAGRRSDSPSRARARAD